MKNNYSPRDQHPSRFKLDAYITASCSSDDRIMIESHCLSCNDCWEYLNAFSDSSAALTSQFPDFKSLDSACTKENSGKKLLPFKIVKFKPFIGPAIAAMFVFALVFPVYFIMHTGRGDGMQVKGSPQWILFTKSQFAHSAAEEIHINALDTVQLFLQADRPLYFTIMYQDDSGPLKLYGVDNELLRNSINGKPVPLPFSIVLDSLWSIQDIYCMASEKKLSQETILSVIVNYGKLNDKNTGISIRKFTLYRK